jgi:hypothetical protein
MFGITLNESHCVGHDYGGSDLVCGDGCFNHGLSVLAGTINAEHAAVRLPLFDDSTKTGNHE